MRKARGLRARQGEHPVAPRKARTEFDCLSKEPPCVSVVLAAEFGHMPEAALIGAPGVETFRRSKHRTPPLGIINGWNDSGRHRLGDSVLPREDEGQFAVIALRPDKLAGLRLDQPRGRT